MFLEETLDGDRKMKMVIAGGRDFSNYELLKAEAIKMLKGLKPSEITIISGTAKGADMLGEQFAKEYSIKILQFPANWDEYGKRAGYLRNTQMAENADALLAFWDGKSRGTGHMITIAKEKKLQTTIITY